MRIMHKWICVIVVVVVVVSIILLALALNLCHYREPVLSTDHTQGEIPNSSDAELSPYGMYDYSKRAFFTDVYYAGTIYQNDIYYVNSHMELARVSLNNLTCDMRTETVKTLPNSSSVCPITSHGHNLVGCSHDCPGNLNGGNFLLDAYESAGDFPIIYCYTTYQEATDSDGEWDMFESYDVYRFDTGSAQRELLIEMTEPITQMMSYDDWLYIVTRTAENRYELNVISKKGGKLSTISIGDGKLNLLGVYNDQIYFRDADATIYQANTDLKNSKEVYQVAEDLSMSMSADGFDSVFIHDDYLYYCADFEAIPFAISPAQSINLLRHSVRRLPLDQLQGEGVVVAENVLDDSMFGIVENVFYYAPCEPSETQAGYYWNYTGGKLKGVDLETLKEVYSEEDCGLVFASTCTVMSGRAMIDSVFRTKEGYNIPYSESVGYRYLYDIQTGALYPLYTT